MVPFQTNNLFELFDITAVNHVWIILLNIYIYIYTESGERHFYNISFCLGIRCRLLREIFLTVMIRVSEDDAENMSAGRLTPHPPADKVWFCIPETSFLMTAVSILPVLRTVGSLDFGF